MAKIPPSPFTDNDSCWAARESGRGERGNRLKNVKSNESQLGGGIVKLQAAAAPTQTYAVFTHLFLVKFEVE